MITAPTNWDAIWASNDFAMQVRIVVSLQGSIAVTYENDSLSSCSISGALFNDLSLGNACSARLSFTVIDAAVDYEQFRRNQKVVLSVRLQQLNGGEATSTYSGWAQLGVFYIDSYTLNDTGNINIVAYDALNVMQDMASQQTEALSIGDYLNRLRLMYGTLTSAMYSDFLDYKINYYSSSVNYVSDLQVPQAANSVTGRDVMSSIAGLAGGNVIVGRDGNFKLHRAMPAPSTTANVPTGAIEATAAQLSHRDRLKTATCACVNAGGEQYQNRSGWAIVSYVDSVFPITDANTGGNNNTVYGVESSMHINASEVYQYNLQYANVSASGVYITPLFELGDIVSIQIENGQHYNFPIASYTMNVLAGCWGELSFPVTDNAFVYRTADEWTSPGGWIGTWFDVHLNYGNELGNPAIEILNSHMFALKRVLLANTPTVVSINNGTLGVSSTITYEDDNGVTKTATISGQLSEQYLPTLLNENGNPYSRIEYLYFYSANIPSDAIGKTSTSSTLKIRTSGSTSTEGTLISIKGIR